jgi:hypothetical protein
VPASCAATRYTLASNQRNPYGLIIDATTVYWVNEAGGQVMKCAIGGCGNTPTLLAAGLTHPVGIAVDSSDVYWTDDSATGGLFKCPLAGCPNLVAPPPYATGTKVTGVAVDGTNVYWTN